MSRLNLQNYHSKLKLCFLQSDFLPSKDCADWTCKHTLFHHEAQCLDAQSRHGLALGLRQKAELPLTQGCPQVIADGEDINISDHLRTRRDLILLAGASTFNSMDNVSPTNTHMCSES